MSLSADRRCGERKFNPRPERGLNPEPSGWQSEILLLCQPRTHTIAIVWEWEWGKMISVRSYWNPPVCLCYWLLPCGGRQSCHLKPPAYIPVSRACVSGSPFWSMYASNILLSRPESSKCSSCPTNIIQKITFVLYEPNINYNSQKLFFDSQRRKDMKVNQIITTCLG